MDEITEKSNLKPAKIKALISSLVNRNYIEALDQLSIPSQNIMYKLLSDGQKYLSENGYFD